MNKSRNENIDRGIKRRKGWIEKKKKKKFRFKEKEEFEGIEIEMKE